jgi:hypothetical protein
MLDAAVHDLTVRVDHLEEAIAGADGAALEDRFRRIESVVAGLRSEVAKLRKARADQEKQRELRLPWNKLTAEQAEHRWTDLRAWVGELVIRNGIGPKEIPNCWYLHDGLVDELEALRWACIEANRPDAKGIEPLWWREALHKARARWTAFNPNGCALDHSETRTRRMTSEPE